MKSNEKERRTMRIKKLTAVAMTGMMVFGMGTSVCAASPITQIGGADTKDVKATYATNQAAQTVYSVDIAWGDMQYTYTVPSEGTWNPEKHQFDGALGAGVWSCSDGADKVKVTNHSNAAVKAAFTYEAESDYQSINGSFDKQDATLQTAEGTAVSKAPTYTATLSLSGALKKNVQAPTKIGTATVTLNAVD